MKIFGLCLRYFLEEKVLGEADDSSLGNDDADDGSDLPTFCVQMVIFREMVIFDMAIFLPPQKRAFVLTLTTLA